MTPRRLFLVALAATLALDIVSLLVFHVPIVDRGWLAAGRVTICLAAGFVGSRRGAAELDLVRATMFGALVATALGVGLNIATGALAMDASLQGLVYSVIAMAFAAALVGSVLGAGAGHLLWNRVREA